MCSKYAIVSLNAKFQKNQQSIDIISLKDSLVELAWFLAEAKISKIYKDVFQEILIKKGSIFKNLIAEEHQLNFPHNKILFSINPR